MAFLPDGKARPMGQGTPRGLHCSVGEICRENNCRRQKILRAESVLKSRRRKNEKKIISFGFSRNHRCGIVSRMRFI